MATHLYNSWGRTRGPKNIAGAHGTAATILAHNAPPTTATHGYSTENQRYLHVTLDVVAPHPGQNLNIWTYSHASGMWSLFTQINYLREPVSYDKTDVIEIDGCDRVAFQSNSGAMDAGTGSAPTAIYAACSTF